MCIAGIHGSGARAHTGGGVLARVPDSRFRIGLVACGVCKSKESTPPDVGSGVPRIGAPWAVDATTALRPEPWFAFRWLGVMDASGTRGLENVEERVGGGVGSPGAGVDADPQLAAAPDIGSARGM